MSEEKKEKLTIDNPVPQETLDKFRQLDGTKTQVALRFLDLEKERVRLLRIDNTVDQERQKLFEGVLIERGISPTAQVEIDSVSGVIKLLTTEEPPEES